MQFKGFRPVRMGDGSYSLPSCENAVIVNSGTITEGDAIKLAAWLDAADAITDPVDGFALGFLVKAGQFNLPLVAVSGNSTYVDGTFTSATTGDTYVAAADNQTDKMISAVYITSDDLILSAYLDATAGTTTGSDLPGYRLDILTTDSTQLDESTAAGTSSATTINDYMTLAGLSGASSLDPADPSGRRVIVKIVDSTVLA